MHALTSQMFRCNGLDIHAKLAGPVDAPVMVMLHGFPEYWAAWSRVANKLLDRFRVVLPDQRGFNLSSKPEGVGAYDTKHMVADLADLVSQISPDRKIILCGHDWGASVAYAFAMRHGDRVSHLVIVNGVHSVPFQRALLAGGAQTDGSQYINYLRAEGSEGPLLENSFQRLLNMFEKFSAAPWLTDEIRSAYRQAWSHPGALTAMLNWYRASPLTVPASGTAAKDLPVTDAMRTKYHIAMPHLLLWGLQDVALLPEARLGLEEFCADLTLREIDDASHWILHEKPDVLADEIVRFVT